MKIIITESQYKVLINERKKNPNLEFIKKMGFKLECSNCDSPSTSESGKSKTYFGEWNKYYLIVNNKNSCSSFPIGISGYDKSSWDLSYRVDGNGDALIIATFNFETKIIESAQILLCDKLYTKKNFLDFKILFQSNSPTSDRVDSHRGMYWVWLDNLTHQKMQEVIEWINNGHRIVSQNVIKIGQNNGLGIA